MDTFSPARLSGRVPLEALMETSTTALHLQVRRIIHATGRFLEDVIIEYFQGINCLLPIISPRQFYRHIVHSRAYPPADFSILLLSICLLTYCSDPERHASRGDESVDRGALYLATKQLFAQVQGTASSPTIHLIRAGILLAVYEYAYGKPGTSLVTVAGCTRMAYAARLHQCTTNDDREAVNTWWAIVILERYALCPGPSKCANTHHPGSVLVCEEPAQQEQLIMTSLPSGDDRLPTEIDALVQENTADSWPLLLVDAHVGRFACVAQAAGILDDVLVSINEPDLDARLAQLDRLDTTLQSFLQDIMQLQQRQDTEGLYCGAVNVSIR